MRVYLDHNATTPPLPVALAAVQEALRACGNPSSVHEEGRTARMMMEDARLSIARLAGAKPGEVVFTSGGTEANSLALRGMAAAASALIVSAASHDSVRETARALSDRADIRTQYVNADGIVADWSLLTHSSPGTLVSVPLANNETGVVQPLDGLRDAAKAGGHFLHVDAAQALGRVPVSFRECGADLMTLSAHKMGGIAGCGVLLMRDGLSIAAQVNGGGQELGRRSGTENIAGIAAFGAAAKWAHEHHEDWQRLGALRDAMESEIMSAVPDAVIHSAGTARLPNTSMIGLPGVSGETQVMAMDLAGFAVSSGAACSSGKVKVSHVLAAMGASHPGDAIRISLGPSNTQDEVKRFTAAWIGFARQALMRRAPGKAA